MVASAVKGKEIICYYLYLLNYLLVVCLGATPPLYVSHGWGFSSYQSINTQHACDDVSLLPSASESLTASKQVVWLKGLYVEFCSYTSCITLLCDSQSVICLIKDQMFHERTKHIDIKYYYIREIDAEGKLWVCKINTHFNPAHMMTKFVRS
jgi:hypothetical protein